MWIEAIRGTLPPMGRDLVSVKKHCHNTCSKENDTAWVDRKWISFCDSDISNSSVASPKDESAGWELSYAGIVRPLLSSFFKRVGHMKLLPKVVAKSADRFSTAMDLREHYYSAKENTHAGKMSGMYKVMLPAFMRTALFGTAVFSVYETLSDQAEAMDNTRLKSIIGSSEMLHVAISCINGAIAGATGALTYYIFDVVGHYTKITRQHSPSHVEIKFVRYALSHSVLFGSYELIKHSLLDSSLYTHIVDTLEYLNDDKQDATTSPLPRSNHNGNQIHQIDQDSAHMHYVSPMKEEEEELFYSSPHRQRQLIAYAFCSGVAGGLSGILYELFWLEIEWHHWRAMDWHKPWKWSLKRTWANMKIGMSIAFPSTLAFWAFEFGRE